ncbi:hypothetical protein HZ326_1371 [Fusarium oxysporum f. sp. albedinis]|nr:hypothetical protein HZ326_1371 [Fusarium oxysporum f. sp. albedinis]
MIQDINPKLGDNDSDGFRKPASLLPFGCPLVVSLSREDLGAWGYLPAYLALVNHPRTQSNSQVNSTVDHGWESTPTRTLSPPPPGAWNSHLGQARTPWTGRERRFHLTDERRGWVVATWNCRAQSKREREQDSHPSKGKQEEEPKKESRRRQWQIGLQLSTHSIQHSTTQHNIVPYCLISPHNHAGTVRRLQCTDGLEAYRLCTWADRAADRHDRTGPDYMQCTIQARQVTSCWVGSKR